MGWLVARDRLFQMELSTRAGQGTLTELLGRAALEADRETRHLGLAWSAEQRFAGWDTASNRHALASFSLTDHGE